MNNSLETRNKKYSGIKIIYGAETYTHYEIKKFLGKGDNGEVYETDNGLAIKEQPLKGSSQVKKFISEAHISKNFADLHLGPKIYAAWIEPNFNHIDPMFKHHSMVGKLLMEKIATTYEKKFVRSRGAKFPSKECQEKIVALFEHMIQKGYIHEDNHIGNIGFLKDGQIVMIDFAMARKLPENLNSNVKANLLALTLYIMIDKYGSRILNNPKSEFYKIIYDIRSNKYKFGTMMKKYGTNLQC